MFLTFYEEYLYVIGQLKDRHKLDVEVDHKDIHTFFKNNVPLFKLYHGTISKEDSPSIVVSFHIDLMHAEAVQYFIHIHNVHPQIRIKDSFIQDDNGEYWLGDDAKFLKEIYMTQEILGKWLENHTVDEIKKFAKGPVKGRIRPKSLYDAINQRAEAVKEFNMLGDPDDTDEVH